MTSTIHITVNGEPLQTEARDLATLVTQLGQAPQALATALNGEFVARTARADTPLAEGDAIFTFQPITGG
ncbi:sulfur carrier protein [Comamonas sp. BIGb0124]|uniref:sulfur carrier protein ThiS n=1 Tax=Comamonas sp. BIGb0124 TaxID=2485130 RepID=UPI000FAD9C4D|nr:sulfur carrier protein ThiS [Comamonas sp. BIGb0124]ROR17982.1 sulfur carrier protein [Comamonas sp. BIGb0124]